MNAGKMAEQESQATLGTLKEQQTKRQAIIAELRRSL